MTTTTRRFPMFVVACLLILAGGLYINAGMPGYSNNNSSVTLVAAWGGSGVDNSSAYMQWQIGSHSDHERKTGGTWSRIFPANRGDHVVLTVSPANIRDTASCTMFDRTGHKLTEGTHRCEVLSLP